MDIDNIIKDENLKIFKTEREEVNKYLTKLINSDKLEWISLNEKLKKYDKIIENILTNFIINKQDQNEKELKIPSIYGVN